MKTIGRSPFLGMAIILTWFVLFVGAPPDLFAAAEEVSDPFEGPAVPSGTVAHSKEGNDHVLTLSDDFSIHEEPPDPHWRVVDSKGNVFLLDKLKIKDDKFNKRIVVPAYIADVAKVQMWCAFAEIVLGEAAFSKPVTLH